MKRIAILFATLVLVGCNRAPQDSRIWAERHIQYEKLTNGAYRVTFDTPYFYGDRVRFNGENGRDTGVIVDIVLMEDGQVYYTIDLDGSEELQGGVYADTIELIDRPEVKKETDRTTPSTRTQ